MTKRYEELPDDRRIRIKVVGFLKGQEGFFGSASVKIGCFTMLSYFNASHRSVIAFSRFGTC